LFRGAAREARTAYACPKRTRNFDRRFLKIMSGENNIGFTVRLFIFPALDKRRGWTPTPSAFLQNGGPSTRTENVVLFLERL
jgi:hypothetical protein